MAATASNILQTIFGNGPVETGLVNGVERYVTSEHGGIKSRTPEGSFCSNLEEVVRRTNTKLADDAPFNVIFEASTRLDRAYAACAAIAHSGSASEIPNWFSAEDGNTGADFNPGDCTEAFQDAIGLIASAKVNWWKGNHHTGNRIATGFAARFLKLIGVNAITEYETDIVWCAAHWFDTRAWLSVLGINGITVVRRVTANIAADEAVVRRISSGPAGTAAFLAVFTALSSVAAHPIVGFANSPALTNLAAWDAAAKSIKANPARYHIGSLYLTGQERLILPVMPDPVISFVATAIRFFNRDATILRAAVFNNVADDQTALAAFRSASTFKDEAREHVGVSSWVAASSQ